MAAAQSRSPSPSSVDIDDLQVWEYEDAVLVGPRMLGRQKPPRSVPRSNGHEPRSPSPSPSSSSEEWEDGELVMFRRKESGDERSGSEDERSRSERESRSPSDDDLQVWEYEDTVMVGPRMRGPQPVPRKIEEGESICMRGPQPEPGRIEEGESTRVRDPQPEPRRIGEGDSDFEKRAADIFGALDSLAPSDPGKKNLSDPITKQRSRPIKYHHKPDPPLRSDRERRPEQTQLTSRGSPSRSPPRREWESRKRKRPRSNPPIPNFVSHPDKWKKYDLKDDGAGHLGSLSEDQVNRKAAFQFLDELKVRKRALHDKEEEEEESDPPNSGTSGQRKVMFRKPKSRPSDSKPGSRSTGVKPRSSSADKKTDVNTLVDETSRDSGDVIEGRADRGESSQGAKKPVMEGGVLRMPEYIVGSKISRKRKRLKVAMATEEEEDGGEMETDSAGLVGEETRLTSATTKSLPFLSHLNDEDEDL